MDRGQIPERIEHQLIKKDLLMVSVYNILSTLYKTNIRFYISLYVKVN